VQGKERRTELHEWESMNGNKNSIEEGGQAPKGRRVVMASLP